MVLESVATRRQHGAVTRKGNQLAIPGRNNSCPPERRTKVARPIIKSVVSSLKNNSLQSIALVPWSSQSRDADSFLVDNDILEISLPSSYEPGSRDSSGSIGLVSDYGLEDRTIEVRSPAEAKGFFL
jgi:hypothetical protein